MWACLSRQSHKISFGRTRAWCLMSLLLLTENILAGIGLRLAWQLAPERVMHQVNATCQWHLIMSTDCVMLVASKSSLSQPAKLQVPHSLVDW